MSQYRSYPAYKDSGVEWMNGVPTHWSVTRLGRLASERCDGPFGSGLKSEHYQPSGVRVIRLQNIGWAEFRNDNSAFVSHEYWKDALGGGHEVLPGDLLVAGLGDDNNPLGRACVAPDSLGDALVKADCYRFRLIDSKADPRFVSMSLSANARAECGFLATGATRDRLNLSIASTRIVALPPLEEQKAIALRLDRETVLIDALVAKKTEFIDLLNKKRQALIIRAVTKGLNPKAKMRDSGVAWIGETPEHWQIRAAKRLFAERDERSKTGQEELMTVSHITGVTPRSEKNVNMFEAATTEGYKLCYTNDLVINTLWAWMGAMGISRRNGIVSPAYNVYIPTEKLEPEFVDLLVRMPLFVKEVTRFSKGIWSSRLRLYPEGFFEVRFAVPPRGEQQAIVAKIGIEVRRIDLLLAKTRHSIDLLKQRRSALITAAVTGQIDLRSSA